MCFYAITQIIRILGIRNYLKENGFYKLKSVYEAYELNG